MFMRVIVFIFLAVIPLSCAERDPSPPENVMSREEMVALLQEIYLAESKISKLSLPFDSSKAMYTIVESELFRRNDVTDSLYERSMNWYYEHPEKLIEVYEVLVDSLMVLEKRNQESESLYGQEEEGNTGDPRE